MNAEQLKKSLLQMAMQGNLVEQREEEGNARELLEKIQKEKQHLIKEGKIKKEKSLPQITEKEKPFDIPENWAWVRLNEIATSNIGLTYKPSDESSSGIPVLRANNIQNGKIDLSNNLKRVAIKNIPEKYIIKEGDILICARNGSKHLVGKCAIMPNIDEPYAFGAFMAILRSHYAPFIKYFLESPVFRLLIDDVNTTTINQITQKNLLSTFIPLPPLAEQRRIVEKLEQLLPLVETYGEAQSDLKAMEAALPAQLKKSFLQMAMQGRLAEQREEEGNARELLEKIQKEKQRLIKEGKIKKEKPLPEITENEKPFDIPENWVWVRLRQLVYNKGQKVPDTDFCYIDIGSIDNSSQKLGKKNTVLTPKEAPSRARRIVSSGDILYATVRPYLHNMCILDRDFPFPPIASTGFAAMTCFSGCFNRFLFYYLMSPDFDRYANSTNNAKGIAYPAINDEKLYRALIPLPPLAEQHRIVEKLEQLLPLCDKLVGN